ncbi:MAG: carbon-nitrogen hydrolase family protein, partial [Gammaproteobacteria bacterium]|nr:carbon-nitrogen hydrolase family protein [Gammaproteobacteria bacterium]
RYRKVFPWRPTESFDPGERFVTFDIPGRARIGLSICYDVWFPECTRQLAWMGAELVLNLVKTTTTDREHELLLARANAIFNQLFLVTVNCAAPVGMGRSAIVGPEGELRKETLDAAPSMLFDELDLDRVRMTRERGTCGHNRVWMQFNPEDRPIRLPCYDGAITPQRWRPDTAPAGE